MAYTINDICHVLMKSFVFDPLLVFLSVAYFTVCSSTIASSGDDNTLCSSKKQLPDVSNDFTQEREVTFPIDKR